MTKDKLKALWERAEKTEEGISKFQHEKADLKREVVHLRRDLDPKVLRLRSWRA